MIYIDNDLPISKDLLMLVIGETEGAQVNVRPVYKPKTDEVKKKSLYARGYSSNSRDTYGRGN